MDVHHKQHHGHDGDHHRPFPPSNNRINEADTSSYTYTVHDNTSSKSPAMAAEVCVFPFTSDQWKELERQTMIYKYIRDSIPVPNHLLLPIANPLSTGGNGSIFNLNSGLPKNGKDSEPGRCKRTDGKKWRCSRDVAPYHKYCERHLHRGRPRSRKPVEIHSNDSNNIINKKSRLDQQILPSSTDISPVETPLYLFQPDISVSSHRELTRCLDWAIEEQWHHSLGRNVGLMTRQGSVPCTNDSVFQQDFFQDSLNLIPLPNYSSLDFEDQQSRVENGLTDAWSSEDPHSNESSVFSQGNLSPSYLSLSMGMAAGSEEMGLNVGDTDYKNPQVFSLISPVSWMGSSTPGGPLAEVLGGRTIP